MASKRFFIFILALLPLLSSCAAKSDPLAYQNGVSRAECTLELEGAEYKVAITPGSALTVVEPGEIAGAVFSVTDGVYTVTAGETTRELPKSLIPLMEPILGALSLPEADAKTSTSGDDVRTVKVSANGGDYEIKLAPDGAPSAISYTGAREFVMRGIKLEVREQK